MSGPGVWAGWEAVSAFAPHGAEAAALMSLLVVFLVACGVMYLLVLLFLVVAIGRRRRRGQGSVRGVAVALVIWYGAITAGLLAVGVAGH